MKYVYHGCPPEMVGTKLHPLNVLKDLHPAIYEREVAKYRGHPSRVNLPSKVIPKLDCLWNDVLHCAPIHPRLLYRALTERGLRPDPDLECFRIPLALLDGLPVAVYHRPGTDPESPILDEEITLLESEQYVELESVPAETLSWYDLLAQRGEIFGRFVGVPHVLVQGPIDVSRAEIVRWGDEGARPRA